MMAALEAAEKEGGDIRGRQSAAMLVVTGKATGHSWEDRIIDLRVEDAVDPLAELRRLLRIKRAYMALNEWERLAEGENHDAAQAVLENAMAMAPDMVEIPFWGGLTIAQGGDLDAGCELMMRAVRKDRRWIETVKRLVPAGQITAELAAQVESRLTAASARL
jgi:hypothetical protein